MSANLELLAGEVRQHKQLGSRVELVRECAGSHSGGWIVRFLEGSGQRRGRLATEILTKNFEPATESSSPTAADGNGGAEMKR